MRRGGESASFLFHHRGAAERISISIVGIERPGRGLRPCSMKWKMRSGGKDMTDAPLIHRGRRYEDRPFQSHESNEIKV